MAVEMQTPAQMAQAAIGLIAELRGVQAFTDADVADGYQTMHELARDWLANIPAQPLSTFLGKMQGIPKLTVGQTRATLNIALERERRPAPAPRQPEQPEAAVPATPAIRDGFYTISWPNGGHTTLRVRAHWVKAEAEAGVQVVGFLRGSDNTSEYEGFAFLRGRNVQIWRRFSPDSQPARALRVLLQMPDPEDAGRAYAQASGNCYACGRLLTDPLSIELGIGPVCRSK